MRHARARKALKHAMKERGLNSAALGRLVSVHKSTVLRWLTGSRPDDTMRLKLERVIGLPREIWLTESESRGPTYSAEV